MTRSPYEADFWHGRCTHHDIFNVVDCSFADRKVDGENRRSDVYLGQDNHEISSAVSFSANLFLVSFYPDVSSSTSLSFA